MQSREELLIALLPAVDSFCRMLVERRQGSDPEHVLPRVQLRAAASACVVEQCDGVIEGTTAGLDPSGFLMVRTGRRNRDG